MDVVKTNIELLEGSLTIDSQPGLGHGDDPADAADAGDHPLPDRHGERRALRHPAAGAGRGRLPAPRDEGADRAGVRHRGLSVARPAAADRAAGRRAEPAPAVHRGDQGRDPRRARRERRPGRIAYILVLRSAGRRFGLVVDEVRGTEEIVVKPMHPSIKRVGIFTGATIMGDGRVALIADVAGIVEHARLSFESAMESAADGHGRREGGPGASRAAVRDTARTSSSRCRSCRSAASRWSGCDRIERVGEHEYVTVDGVSMRVLRLDKVINVSAPEPPAAESASQVPLILPKFVRSGDGDPRVADRGHRVVVGRLAGPPGTGSGHPRLGGRPRPADALPGHAPADAEAVRHGRAEPRRRGGSDEAAQAAAPDRRHAVLPRGRQALPDGGGPRGRDRRERRGRPGPARDGPARST